MSRSCRVSAIHHHACHAVRSATQVTTSQKRKNAPDESTQCLTHACMCLCLHVLARRRPQPMPLFPLGRIAAASGAGRRQEHGPTPMAGIELAPVAGPDSEPDNSEGEQASDTQSSAQQAGDGMALDCASHVSICDEPRRTSQGIADTANLAVGVGGVSSLLNPESRIQVGVVCTCLHGCPDIAEAPPSRISTLNPSPPLLQFKQLANAWPQQHCW